MKIRAFRTVAAAMVFTSSACSASAGESACEREMARAAGKHGVPLGVLYSVGLAETGRGNSMRPFALNVEGRAYYPLTKQAALREFAVAQRTGAKLIDVGCMQINHRFHSKNFVSVEEMLEPSKNVEYAAVFLNQLRAREGSWTRAVARYHAGPNNDPAQKRYVCRVIANMVATGFGQWTAEARSFCRP